LATDFSRQFGAGASQFRRDDLVDRHTASIQMLEP
jgi:hypothetical protein